MVRHLVPVLVTSELGICGRRMPVATSCPVHRPPEIMDKPLGAVVPACNEWDAQSAPHSEGGSAGTLAMASSGVDWARCWGIVYVTREGEQGWGGRTRDHPDCLPATPR